MKTIKRIRSSGILTFQPASVLAVASPRGETFARVCLTQRSAVSHGTIESLLQFVLRLKCQRAATARLPLPNDDLLRGTRERGSERLAGERCRKILPETLRNARKRMIFFSVICILIHRVPRGFRGNHATQGCPRISS